MAIYQLRDKNKKLIKEFEDKNTAIAVQDSYKKQGIFTQIWVIGDYGSIYTLISV